jgi:hypothetical protein
MTSRPLIDPSQIDDIIRRAKADQAQYVLNKVESGVGRARLGGVVTLVAACLAVFVTHVNSNGQHGSTGQNTNRSY